MDNVLKLRQMVDPLKEQMGIKEGLDKEILEDLEDLENVAVTGRLSILAIPLTVSL